MNIYVDRCYPVLFNVNTGKIDGRRESSLQAILADARKHKIEKLIISRHIRKFIMF